jgi:hypothetical protein
MIGRLRLRPCARRRSGWFNTFTALALLLLMTFLILSLMLRNVAIAHLPAGSRRPLTDRCKRFYFFVCWSAATEATASFKFASSVSFVFFNFSISSWAFAVTRSAQPL